MIGSDQLSVDKFMEIDMTMAKQEGEGPQILIYHTHSQEAFADSVPGDVNTGIVGVGEYLTQVLTEQYGYRVLHHTGQYDVEPETMLIPGRFRKWNSCLQRIRPFRW